MALDLRIRDGTSVDWERICEVHDAAFKACHVPFLGVDAKAWFNPGGHCYVAETGGCVQGFVYCVVGDLREEYTQGQPFIDDLFVDPAYQGRGIGSALLAAAEAYLAAKDCRT
eukprot:gnl/TRDRNA2_/TRDRNA2_44767_c0_seq1.p2 gnl/TRDRNA2_/TRDRNA2_44767_c0~~gnl/TRDRNA2_/TRDRNA2_44767_c0_seq1.p2  ORF type:complete len:113 (-),score=21.66 gnl/TRDRNA2_/TRDRNA2_44767_c0_seq1:22-360(-)